MSEDDYLWTRTTITYTSGDPSVIYSVSHMAVNGDSIIVKSIVVTYGTSKNPNIKPTNFSTDIPVANPGEYLWCKTVTTYSDGKSVETYSYALQGNDGDSPTVSISKKDNITSITIENLMVRLQQKKFMMVMLELQVKMEIQVIFMLNIVTMLVKHLHRKMVKLLVNTLVLMLILNQKIV